MMTITRHPAHPVAKEEKTIKTSTSDPESGWFHKGEHKSVFAYAVQTACDKNGWILGYSVHPGNHHDSRSFKFLYDKIYDEYYDCYICPNNQVLSLPYNQP